VIGDGLLALVGYPVGDLARFDHGVDMLLDVGGVFGYLADDGEVLCRQAVGFLRREESLHLVDVVDELRLVFRGDGDDVVHHQVAQHARLDLYLLRVGLPLHLVACLQLLPCHHTHRLEHADAAFVEVTVEDERTARLAVQSAACRFRFPFLAVAVAVEADGLALPDVFADDLYEGGHLLFTACHQRVDLLLEELQLLGDGGVEGNHRAGAVRFRPHGTELEAVAGEGEGRGAVAVGVVDEQLGDLRDVELHAVLARERHQFVGRALLHVVEHAAQLGAQERGDDGGRCLVGSQTVGIRGTHDGGFQQSVVTVDSHERVDHEGDEAQVLFRCLARCHERKSRVGSQRPVVVLARAVHALEGLLMEQDTEAVAACHLPHERHDEHVVVDGKVALLVDGRQLELVGGDLVVACLQGNAQFECLDLQVLHESGHTRGDGTEVVVLQLLVLRRFMPHERAACQQQVRTGGIQPFVH